MKAWDREFDEMMAQFEKCILEYPGLYVSGGVERVKPGKDGKVPGGEYYTSGEVSKLFLAYMLGYSYRASIANMEDYKPEIIRKEFIKMILVTRECPCCHKYMMIKVADKFIDLSIFPYYYNLNQDAQTKKAGIVYQSSSKIDNDYICVECANSGKSSFKCALCNEQKSSELQKKSIGDPAEFLCNDCYDNVSAAIWDKKMQELYEKHRYDYE